MSIIKKYTLSIAQLLLFWLLFFGFQRLIFIAYHFNLIARSPLLENIYSYAIGFKLDFTVACYILFIPALLKLLQQFFEYKFIDILFKTYHGLCLIITALLVTIDLELYGAWNAKLNYKVLQYFNQPLFVLASVSIIKILFLSVLFLFQLWVAYELMKKIHALKYFKNSTNTTDSTTRQKIITILCFIVLEILLLIGMRGGLQEIPINPSSIAVSSNFALNNAALNSTWNLIYSLDENKNNIERNPYKILSDEEADCIVDSLYQVKKDTTISIFNLKNKSPHIVLIIMEGINANVLFHHNRQVSYAPFLDSLLDKSYYFERAYSTGFRTDQGVPAILSGYPSQPYTSIITQNHKLIQLPTLTSIFKKRKYKTQFIFGGEVEFGNMKSYLLHNGFEQIIDIKNYDNALVEQKLGVPDEFVFDRFITENKVFNQPLFSVILTQSTHEPYDIKENRGVYMESKKYLNSVQYLDRSLSKFFHRIEREKWFKNTLFIISPDHAHLHPGNYSPGEVERFHTPFIIYSPLLKKEYIGYKDSAVFNQTDFPNTFLHQLKLKSKAFKWSKNHFNPYAQKIAYCTYVNGQLIITDSTAVGYEYRFMRPHQVDSANLPTAKKGWALLQKIMDEYLNY